MYPTHYARAIPVSVLGIAQVGKSSFLQSWHSEQEPTRLVYPNPMTLERCVSRDFGILSLTWQLWRGEGSVFRSILARKGVFLICYAVDDRRSFSIVANQWLPMLTQENAQERLLLLVGLKKDKRDSPKLEAEETDQQSTFVTHEEGTRLSADFGISHFCECSSLDHEEVDQTMENLLDVIVRWQPPQGPQSDSYCCIQ